MSSNQNKYEQKVKTNGTILKVLFGVLVLSLIVFIVVVSNSYSFPEEGAIPLMIMIGSFIAIVILIKNRIPLVEKMRKEQSQQINESNIMEYLSYSEWSKTLTVKKKSKYMREFLTAEQIYIDMRDKKPDSIVYTSATVGGITTGGFEKVEGKTTTKKSATGSYRLFYQKMTNEGKFIKVGEVEFISLPEDLLNEAKLILKDYIYEDKIAILNEEIKQKKKNSAGTAMVMNAAMSVGGSVLAGNYANTWEILEYPDYTKINKIIDWLARE